jgi:hypothetical protein
MKKISKRQERILETPDTLGERLWTRLTPEAEAAVLERVTKANPAATVIRNLVDEALRTERLRAAGRDPSIRELLRTFDEVTTHRIEAATAPLAGQLEQVNRQLEQTRRQLEQSQRFLAALFITYTENLDFSTNSEAGQTDEVIHDACAREANRMLRLILGGERPTDSEPPPATPEAIQTNSSGTQFE